MIKSIFTNSFGILISRILGFIRDLLTASILGANIYSDIFFVAFKLPNLFRRIFAEGAFSQSFIPAFTKSKYKAVFCVNILIIFSLIILSLCFLVSTFPKTSTKLIAFGFNDELINLAYQFVSINFYYLLLIFIVTFLSALLHYKGHFATTAFATSILNISLIIALILSRGKDKETIVYYLSYGVLIGGVGQVIAHIIAIKYKNLSNFLYLGLLNFRNKRAKVKEELKSFYKQFLPAIIGNSNMQLSAFLDTFLASFLLSGSISYLYYANRVFQLPLALFAIATSVVLFPRIAKVNKDNEKSFKLFKKSFWILINLLAISTTIGISLNEEIIKLLFQRGSFLEADTKESAFVLKMYLIGLIPYGLSKLFSIHLYVNEKMKKAALISTYVLVVNIILSVLLINPLKVGGLALASSLSGILLFCLNIKFFGIKRFLDIILDKKILLIIIINILLFTLLHFSKGFFYVYF